jgi:hypothetical protein
MPVGGVGAAAKDINERRAAGSKGGARFFKLKDGESKVVRFLEEGKEIHWAWTHKMPPQGNQKWGDDVPCLDQAGTSEPCPGCEEGLPKKFKGFISLIERDADKFATVKGDDGKERIDWNTVVGNEDAIAVWESGITVFEELDGCDADYKGLKSRDFKITRKGSGLNTAYAIRPMDAGEMSAADRELEARKPDLSGKIKVGSYDEMRKRLIGGVAPDQGAGGGNAPTGGGDVNPFLDPDAA